MHSAAVPFSGGCFFSVHYRQRHLAVFYGHGKQRTRPHPENGTGSALQNGCGNTGDVAHAQCTCQRHGDSFHRCGAAFRRNISQCFPEPYRMQQTMDPYGSGKDQTADKQHDRRAAECKEIQYLQEYRIRKIMHRWFPPVGIPERIRTNLYIVQILPLYSRIRGKVP